MQDHTSGADTARRAKQLRALGEAKKSAFRAAQAGSRLRVLTLNRTGEDCAGPWTLGLSGNYVDVRVRRQWPANQFLDVEVSGESDGHVAGIAIETRGPRQKQLSAEVTEKTK